MKQLLSNVLWFFDAYQIGIQVIVVVACFLGLVVSIGCGIHRDGYGKGRDDTRQEAVREGAGYYTADENGRPAFNWRKPEVK